ncbi:MAG: restriction endonuclease subunit S [Chloroflexi bacterium]|nr:restriction endonuclease subunit S [Chloroflexota bacterium]
MNWRRRWRRRMVSDLLLEAFGQMVSRAGDVGRLNAAILQLAVQGKLVAQDPNDEPASELLKRIAAEKKRLKIKSEPLPEIGEEERPFALPDGWEWVRFGDATLNRDSERIPLSREQRKPRQGAYDYYGASGVIDKIDDYLFDKPLLLIGEDGANLINRSTPIAFLAYGKYWVNNHAHVLDSLNLDVLKYLAVFINAIDLKPYVTGTAQPKMNQSKMNSIVVALPPLAEQKRIVERVDALLAQTRELESRLSQAETTLTALHETAVNTLLSATDPDDFTVRWQFIAENFDLLYDETYPETALANVAALKQAILQLAVQGKLTHQDPGPKASAVSSAFARREREGIKKEIGWILGGVGRSLCRMVGGD